MERMEDVGWSGDDLDMLSHSKKNLGMNAKEPFCHPGQCIICFSYHVKKNSLYANTIPIIKDLTSMFLGPLKKPQPFKRQNLPCNDVQNYRHI